MLHCNYFFRPAAFVVTAKLYIRVGLDAESLFCSLSLDQDLSDVKNGYFILLF